MPYDKEIPWQQVELQKVEDAGANSADMEYAEALVYSNEDKGY